MKTVRQWAEHLPEPIRSQFLENVVKQRGEIYLEIVKKPDLGSCISGCIVWDLTTQEPEYWFEIYKQAKSGRFDIPPHIQAATIADDEQAD